MKLLSKYLRPFYLQMALGLLIKSVGTLMDLFLPWILEHILDEVVPRRKVSEILFWGFLMLVCSAIALLGNMIANRKAAQVARNTTRGIRHDLFEKTIKLSNKTVDEYSVPTLETRLTSDTYNIHQMIGMMQRVGVRAPILLFGGILLAALMDPILTLVMASVLPFIFIVFYFVSKKGIPIYTALQGAVDKMVRVVRENIQGIRVIKALSKTTYEKEHFTRTNQEVTDTETRAGTVMAMTNPFMNVFLNLGLVAVIAVGAIRVNGGTSEPGKIIAFLTYFTIILNAMLSINRIFVMYSKGSASAKRIQEILDLPTEEEIHALKSEPVSPTAEEAPRMEFRNVSFSYNNKKMNLSDISFRLMRGQTLGIIGATGSGKTTLINLMMRFYDVNAGEILIDGSNITAFPLHELRAKFGIALQNDFIMGDTIQENISFGRALEHDAVSKAAEIAQAKQFIEATDAQYEHMLTAKGTNVSGGQRQRLLISRALAAKPEILILDDSSSALDYQTDAALRRAIAENCRGTSMVVVAQRVSSVMNADLILVLEEGRVIGAGRHEQLLANCPVYQQISNSQLGGTFIE